MRLFIGVWLENKLKKAVSEYIAAVTPKYPGWHWTKLQNLHFTLKFLGEIPDHQVGKIQQGLRAIKTDYFPFTLQLGEVGVFPSRGTPRILWLGLSHGQNELCLLAQEVEEACQKMGLSYENKPFTPHLTIARAVQGGLPVCPKDPSITLNGIGQQVNGFSLIQSVLQPGGSKYITKEDFGGTI